MAEIKPKAGAGSYRLFRALLDRVGSDNEDGSGFISKLNAWRLRTSTPLRGLRQSVRTRERRRAIFYLPMVLHARLSESDPKLVCVIS